MMSSTRSSRTKRVRPDHETPSVTAPSPVCNSAAVDPEETESNVETAVKQAKLSSHRPTSAAEGEL